MTSPPFLPIPAPAPLAPWRTGSSIVRHRPPAPYRGNPKTGGERGSQEQLAPPEMRTGPLLLLLPRRHLFAFLLSVPVGLEIPQIKMRVCSRAADAGTKGGSCSPSGSLQTGAGVFPRSCAVFCRCLRHRINFCSFAPPQLYGRKLLREERAAPGIRQESGSAECGERRRSALWGRTALWTPGPANFPACMPGLPAQKKSRAAHGFRCGSVIKPRSHSVTFDIFA